MEILIIAAHPDDEVLGCGGTLSMLSEDNDVYTLILGEGVTSRTIPDEDKIEQLKELKKQSKQANKILGVKEVFFEIFLDNKFDTVPLLEIIKIIERYIQRIEPDVIYSHHHGDLNIDHQITHKAVLTAVRPVGYTVKKVLSFEVLSSTEWNIQTQSNLFTPNTYIDISETLNKKLEAMQCYQSELMDYPHPRSLEGIKILAQKRGLEVGLKFAEAFCLIREIERR